MTTTLKIDKKENGVVLITFNRPEALNAINLESMIAFWKAIRDLQQDADLRVLVLTGEGEKAFCSGGDLVELRGFVSQDDARYFTRIMTDALHTMEQLPVPVIAAINGYALGGGSEIALACDMRIVSDQASFVFAAFSGIGIIPDAGTTYFLPQLVGTSKALELSLFANGKNRVSPEEAYRLGIANRVIAHDDLAEESKAIGLQLANMATVAVGLTKRILYKSVERSLSDALETEAQLQGVAFKTQDFQEGVMAFIEKREANFKGE